LRQLIKRQYVLRAVFQIEDTIHAEPLREFSSLGEAFQELQRLALVPWDQEPNRAPCTGWRKCGRWWAIVEYDTSTRPWKRLQEEVYLDVSASGVCWPRLIEPHDT
jgi:hypothetical protein